MFCENCGAAISNAQATCPACGHTGPMPAATSAAPAVGPTLRSLVRAPKTGTDRVCGFCFLASGALALGLHLLFLLQLGPTAQLLLEALSNRTAYQLIVLGGLLESVIILPIMGLLAMLCGSIAGLLLILAGLRSLRLGKGKRGAYAAVVLLLFVTLMGVASWFVVAGALSGGPPTLANISSTYASLLGIPYLFAFAPAPVLAIICSVLLGFKKVAKKRALSATPAQRQVYRAVQPSAGAPPIPGDATPGQNGQ